MTSVARKVLPSVPRIPLTNEDLLLRKMVAYLRKSGTSASSPPTRGSQQSTSQQPQIRIYRGNADN